MQNKLKEKITLSLFGAIIIVLQIVATFINFGAFPITLTLIPIIIAGAIFGIFAGSLMGLVFGVIVSIMVITGADPSGAFMFSTKPFITIFVCLLKGTLAGLFSALVYKKINNKKIAIFVAAATAPVVNTLTLQIFLILFFDSSFAIMVSTFVSINFVVEFILNVALAPGLLRIINMRRR